MNYLQIKILCKEPIYITIQTGGIGVPADKKRNLMSEEKANLMAGVFKSSPPGVKSCDF